MGQFISFAQNFEDVVLWRALKHVKEGFYVDCGAYSPSCHSVTRAFYERGWRGINIEPVPRLLGDFEQQRPDDINLNLAVSDHADRAIFYEILDTGLSTFNPETAQAHIEAGFVAHGIEVRTASLSEILAEHALEAIHFLKVDVEGAEQLVLRGLDLNSFRPWIIIVESVRPQTQEPSHGDWEAILLTQGYNFTHFDGLNRFYVAKEHPELSAALVLPPNIFDNFVQVENLTALANAQHELALLKSSSSWRMTAPIRNAKLAFQALRDGFPERITAFFKRTAPTRRRPSKAFVFDLSNGPGKRIVRPS